MNKPWSLLSHRGRTPASMAPDNTLLAFADAAESGAAGFETDVRGGRHGRALLTHDARLPDGTPVDEVGAAHVATELGHQPVVLAEALDAFPTHVWNIEIKDAAAVPGAIDALRADGGRGPRFITSFQHALARHVGEATGLPFGYLVGHIGEDMGGRFRAWWARGARSIVLPIDLAARPIVEQAAAAGLRIGVFDVESREQLTPIADLLTWCITDGFTTA